MTAPAGPAGQHETQPRSAAALAAIGLALVAAFVCLVLLGNWQVRRRVWKLDLIARVDARLKAPPVAAPGPAAWGGLTADKAAYTRVEADGVFEDTKVTRVQAVTARGPGFWLMAPLATDRGFTLLVNRGFVPPGARWSEPAGKVRVIGLLRITEPKGGFLRRNDPDHERWYSRDVSAIAAARGLPGPVAPYFVDADASGEGGYPIGGLTVVSFPNSHLVYAITWYGLALLVAVAGGALVRSEMRARR